MKECKCSCANCEHADEGTCQVCSESYGYTTEISNNYCCENYLKKVLDMER